MRSKQTQIYISAFPNNAGQGYIQIVVFLRREKKVNAG